MGGRARQQAPQSPKKFDPSLPASDLRYIEHPSNRSHCTDCLPHTSSRTISITIFARGPSGRAFIKSLALSRISGYRLADWLRVFGFDLEDITRLQILLPSKRTIVLDTSLSDPNEWTPWLRNRPLGEPIPSITPLARLLELGPRRRIATVIQLDRRFIYAKVGVEDAFAFPELTPGSIVRVDPGVTADLQVNRTPAFLIGCFSLSTARASVVAVSVS